LDEEEFAKTSARVDRFLANYSKVMLERSLEGEEKLENEVMENKLPIFEGLQIEAQFEGIPTK